LIVSLLLIVQASCTKKPKTFMLTSPKVMNPRLGSTSWLRTE